MQCKAAVAQSGIALKYASVTCRADHDIVMAAVCMDGDALEFAAQELRNDYGIVEAAVRDVPTALGSQSRYRQVTDLDVTVLGFFGPRDCLPSDRCSVGTRPRLFSFVLVSIQVVFLGPDRALS